MPALTPKQSRRINSVAPNYSINYEVEAAGPDVGDLEARAVETIVAATAADENADLGGIRVFFKEGELVAFYDYERFVGHIF